ncbi:MAG TPA: IS200/IS605 family transposase [Gemmatimonadales bacterium]|nr:IS200/IS605 family transposase [Gemmatimonadales bacterium]
MSTHQLFIHLVWTTHDRLPMIDAPTKAFLDEFFKKTASRQDVEVIDLEILQTHVHMLIRTPPRIDLPRLVQFLKGGSSYSASRLPGNVLGLRWAPEYSSTSVGPRQLEAVSAYFRKQANHHPGEGI